MAQPESDDETMIDVRRAAVLVGRHPETIRRWVWSGRLAARRRNNRLFLTRDEVEAVARQEAARSSLRAWQDAELLAPRLLLEEVSNALLTGIRRGRWSGRAADASHLLLRRLPVRLVDEPSDLERAWA